MQPQSIQIPRPSETHVWQIDLEQQESTTERFERLLSSDERGRSEQFHFDHLRERYILTHGALRMILAGYFGKPPEKLQFGHGRFGKPFLVDPPVSIEFNLSHCEDLALVAITDGRSVGIDVEKVRELQYLDSIINRFFSAEEQRFITSVPAHVQARAFLTLWTRREAAAKACGLNLAAALGNLEIPTFPYGGGAVIGKTGGGDGTSRRSVDSWFLRDLEIGADHRGAVCVEGKMCELLVQEFK